MTEAQLSCTAFKVEYMENRAALPPSTKVSARKEKEDKKRERERGVEIENPTSELRSVRSVPVCLPDGIVVGSVRFLDEVIVSRGVASDEFGNV